MGIRRITHASAATRTRMRTFASDMAARLPGVIDVISKLAVPIAAAIVAVIGHHIQQSMATTQMLIQRETADTQIRAEMFKATTEQLFTKDKDRRLSTFDEAVFAELLALNFHEHIELKPLLLEVDARLDAKQGALRRNARALSGESGIRILKADSGTHRTMDRVSEFRSVARRVRSRQTAMLVGELSAAKPQGNAQRASWNLLSPAHASAGLDGNRGALRFLGVRRKSVCKSANLTPAENLALDSCAVQANEGQNDCTSGLIQETSPGGQSLVNLTVREQSSDFRRQRFEIGLKDVVLHESGVESQAPDEEGRKDGKGNRSTTTPTGASMVDFQVTWFDFPLTDNTLLASGERFAVFIDQVCKRHPLADEVDAIRLGLLWFPRDFYPARERPTNFRQFREKLGLIMGPSH
jgi:hypothetical protein